MQPCPENCVTIGRAVVYYARAAHAFSAGITCRHGCRWVNVEVFCHVVLLHMLELARVCPEIYKKEKVKIYSKTDL